MMKYYLIWVGTVLPIIFVFSFVDSTDHTFTRLSLFGIAGMVSFGIYLINLTEL